MLNTIGIVLTIFLKFAVPAAIVFFPFLAGWLCEVIWGKLQV